VLNGEARLQLAHDLIRIAAIRRVRRRGVRAMSRLSLFNSPLLLGFDQFEQALNRISKAPADGYPPYNIEQTSENGLRITLAVAGFAEEDLAITLEGNQLLVRGKQAEDDDRVYLHRGIAARQFQRSFVLAEGIEVSGAFLDNGLLNIDLERPAVEETVRTVKIERAAKGAAKKSARTSIDVEDKAGA
jgi:HSP20 family molecular chaperone IbpA